jgi:hypothetical protein
VNHQRHIIREAIVAALAAGSTPAGARVYDCPTDVRTTFPALVVEDLAEQQSATTLPGGATRIIERMLMIEVTAEIQQTATPARARDQLLADVERVIGGLVIAGVKSIVPTNFAQDRDGAGERPIFVGRQRFEVTYCTPQGDPSVTR